MQSISSWTAVDSPDFLSSLRTIFDAFDVAKSGRIRFEDVAIQWQIANQVNPDGSPQLTAPPELMMSLREVSRNGVLSFDLFVRGVRLALERARRNDELRLARTNSSSLVSKTRPISMNTNLYAYADVTNLSKSAPSMPSRMRASTQPPYSNVPPGFAPRTFPNRNGVRTASQSSVFPVRAAQPWTTGPRPISALIQRDNQQQNNEIARRHTFNGSANAIDMNAVRCLGMLDDESALLHDGIAEAERVAAHLRVRLAENERMRIASTNGTASVELSILTARVSDARRRLEALRSALEMPRKSTSAAESESEWTRQRFDAHWNLHTERDETVADLLRSQNRLLTREVTDLRTQLARVDGERAMLMRTLLDFDAPRSNTIRSSLPASFSTASANYANLAVDSPYTDSEHTARLPGTVPYNGFDNLLAAASNHNLNDNALAFLQAQSFKTAARLADNDSSELVVESAAYV